MKTKLVLFLMVAALTVSAQTNSVHTWTLKTGAKFTGDYFTSGTEMVVIKSHGTNCLLKISDLSTNDWLYFQECKAAQRQRQLDAKAVTASAAGVDTKSLVAQGYIEFTPKLIENYPEKVDHQNGWMDAEFSSIGGAAKYHEDFNDMLGFSVVADGSSYDHCVVVKNLSTHIDDQIMKLKDGDKIRLTGHVVVPEGGRSQGWLMVDTVTVLNSVK